MIKFIHIPKTAGTSMYNALKSGEKDFQRCGHETFAKLRRSFSNKDVIISCVRNPYDKAVSTFYFVKYIYRNGGPAQILSNLENPSQYWIHNNKTISRISKTNRDVVPYIFKPQIDFLREKPNEGVSKRINKVFKYENLKSEWRQFAEENNIPDLQHYNKSTLREGLHWSEELNEEATSIIREIYSEDFYFFDYEK
jgi:hypothetical protein